MLKLRKKDIKKILINNEGFVIAEKGLDYVIKRGRIVEIKTYLKNDRINWTSQRVLSPRRVCNFLKKHLSNIKLEA